MSLLEAWARKGASPEAALSGFDALDGAPMEMMRGRWRGTELPTGHPLDGLLGRYDWYGKRFGESDDVDPLLFRRGRELIALEPARMPVGMALAQPGLARSAIVATGFRLMSPLFRARGPGARLRTVVHRGKPSTAMIYDALPIIDHFRRIDDDRLLGLMDLRQTSAPYFFLLTRDD